MPQKVTGFELCDFRLDW